MAQCDNCDKPVKFQYSSLFGGVQLCEECKSLNVEESDLDESDEELWNKINIVGMEKDLLPDDAKRDIINRIREEGWDPESGSVIVAGDVDEMFTDLADDDDMKRIMVLLSRHVFMHGSKMLLEILHILHHIGVSDEELIPLIKRFGSFAHELASDYLFIGDDNVHKSEEELIEIFKGITISCNHKQEKEDE